MQPQAVEIACHDHTLSVDRMLFPPRAGSGNCARKHEDGNKLPADDNSPMRNSRNIARARCNARLTASWLSSSRDAAAVMLFSSAIAANVIRRFKSTCRSFSKRMADMIIMHEPHVVGNHLWLCKQ